MVDHLKEKAAKGILWKFLEQGGVQLIQFISGIYIARILLPEHYGLIGMMAIFLGISQVFVDSGFKVALIQKGASVSQDDYNVVFYFNIVVSIVFCLFIYFSAPAISRFYNEPALIPVARVLGVNLILGSSSIVHAVIFEKKLNFRTNTKIRLLSVVVSTIVGIVLANLGYGVWALVFMLVVETVVRTLLYWIINTWRPALRFDLASFKLLFSNGSKILLTGILGQLNLNVYSLIIGRYFTTIDVGYYSQGRKLQQRIGDFISNSMQGVMFPVLSLVKDDKDRLKKSVRKNVIVSSIIAFPAIVGLIAIAKPFVLIFLTEKWLPSVYYLQILSFAGLIFIANHAIKSYLIPLGKFNVNVIYVIISSIVLFGLIGGCILYGADIEFIVGIKIIFELLNFVAMVVMANYFINYRLSEIIGDLMPAILISATMGVVVYFIGDIFGVSFLVLFSQIFVGCFIYLVLNYIFNKNLVYEFVGIFKQQFVKPKG